MQSSDAAAPTGPVDRLEVRHEATWHVQQLLTESEHVARRIARELGVNATDYRALEHLLVDGALTPTELARRLGVTNAAITTSVDRLARRGHVDRQPDPDDRRRVRIVPAGDSVARAIGLVAPMVRDLDAQLACVSDRDREVITDYLRRVVDTMHRHATSG